MHKVRVKFFTYPEFNGEVRLIAQAWTADKFGSQEGKVVIAAPLVTQLSLPRFMAGGDNALLSLDLTNLTDDAQSITPNYTASGLVGLGGAESKTVSLTKGERTQIQIPKKRNMALDKVNSHYLFMVLKYQVKIKPYHNTWNIGVRPHSQQKLFTMQVHCKMVILAFIIRNFKSFNSSTLEGELLLTSRPPLQVARYIRKLFAYPYGCLEQTVSGLYPSLYSTEKKLKQLGIKTQTDADRK